MSREDLTAIFHEAIKAVNPSLLVERHLRELDPGKFKRRLLIGFGKSSVQMAYPVYEYFDKGMITEGIVITKYGHSAVQQNDRSAEPLHYRTIALKIYEAGHPVPDENGMEATNEVLRLVSTAAEDTMVISLISGGGSALLVSPCNGITLAEKQEVTDLLLKAGADINEINAVRKHISKVKGGRLAEIAHPAEVVSLILSDVIGDRLDVIASGPTAPDPTTYAEALDVIDKYGLSKRIPRDVMDVLKKGREGKISETPDDSSPVFRKVRNVIIGNNRLALEAARECAERRGYIAEIIGSTITGEARDAGRWLADKAREFKGSMPHRPRRPLCLISGGETTVTVRGSGRGGRNTELALSFAIEVDGIEGITLLSAGTDGTDGPTDAAGAVVNGDTVRRAIGKGLDPRNYLNNNDSYTFFEKTGELLITGPTGTNVMDMQLIVIE
jgi:glycerate-2-kinase